ncbi:hypothetical protein [Rhodoferax sp.]|uniref:hypothetical protein n=1 Tax=Rhodoferax sp. TaxID=50421 RepID=UPI00260332D4|nr:hypothetical protein [Rhodoferax sp.]MDD5479670.1 hypothetical protein [Rhodoferax sp.]
MKTPPHTPEQAQQWLDEHGLSKAEVARRFQVSVSLVDAIVRGQKPCKRGASHNIAVFLGLKVGQAVAAKHDEVGFRKDGPVIGGDYVPADTVLSDHVAQQLCAVLMAGFAEVQARLQALHDQIASLRQAPCSPLRAAPLPQSPDSPAPLLPTAAPAPHTHCAARSAPCASVAPRQSVVAPEPGLIHGHSLRTPKVD